MGKETFYFSHDYNVRSDSKIKRLLAAHGMVGYGAYWAIVEDLYNNNNSIEADFEMIAFDLRIEACIVKSVVEDFKLFEVSGEIIRSNSVANRLAKRSERSQVGRENAAKRWENTNAKVSEYPGNCQFYIIELYKGDERFLKCGITSESVSRRYSGKTKEYKYEILYSTSTTTYEAVQIERAISERFQRYTPNDKFGGYLECYDICEKSKMVEFAVQRECKPNAIKESKVKESKVKERNLNTPNGVSDSDEPDAGSGYDKVEKTKAGIYAYLKTRTKDLQPYVDYWNIFAEENGKAVVKALSEKRKQKLRVRVREDTFNLNDILVKAKHSELLRTSKWFGLDWLVANDTNYLKVLEGNYDNAPLEQQKPADGKTVTGPISQEL